MRIAGRSITFARKPARSYGYRSLATLFHPDDNAGVLRKPLRERGNDYPDVAPESRRITDPGQISGRLSAGGALPGYPTPLDTGLPPQRIRRHTQAADRGAVGPGTNVGRSGALGYNADTNGGSQTIPHIRIPRTPITVTAFRRTIDMTSSIPTRGIGAPVR